MWWLLDKQDRKASLSAVSEIDIAACEDPEILTLFLDVSSPEMPFTTKVEVLDRIITNTHKASEVLQCTILKGIAYCLINEIPQSCEIMEEAIASYKGLGANKRLLAFRNHARPLTFSLNEEKYHAVYLWDKGL